MIRPLLCRTSVTLMLLCAGLTATVVAQTPETLPSPLTLADVVRVANGRRSEIEAARARTRAAEQRPVIVSALPDPMVSPSLDHLPFMWSGADVSVTFEQQIPLSGVRQHRRTSALADVDRLRAESGRTALGVCAAEPRASGAEGWRDVVRRAAMCVEASTSVVVVPVRAPRARRSRGRHAPASR